jgi:Tat protein secretion system quality control protein TatD with DNase activity
MNYCDAHCHLANLSQIMPLEPLFEEAAAHKLTCFLSSALSRTELDWYAEHSKAYNILYSAGIHPSFEPCDLQFEDIEGLCREGKIWAIGEIGLDKGNPEYALMKAIFVKQVDLAMDYRLPVVLHIVGHQQEAYEILKVYPLKYLIHGYAGSVQAFRQFLKLDSYLRSANASSRRISMIYSKKCCKADASSLKAISPSITSGNLKPIPCCAWKI